MLFNPSSILGKLWIHVYRNRHNIIITCVLVHGRVLQMAEAVFWQSVFCMSPGVSTSEMGNSQNSISQCSFLHQQPVCWDHCIQGKWLCFIVWVAVYEKRLAFHCIDGNTAECLESPSECLFQREDICTNGNVGPGWGLTWPLNVWGFATLLWK